MKKLIFICALFYASLNSMNSDFQIFKTKVETAVTKCTTIQDKDKRFEKWEKKYRKLCNDSSLSNKKKVDFLIQEANNQGYSNPVFRFLVLTKNKEFCESIVGRVLSWFSKKSKDIELTDNPTISQQEQLKNYVIQAAQDYRIILPFTDFMKKILAGNVGVKYNTIRYYNSINNEYLPIVSGNHLTTTPSPVDLHYLSLLPKIYHAQVGYFRAIHLKTIPEAFCQFDQLEALNLYENELTELPKKFVALKNLKVLDLGHNKFKKLPALIGNLALLETLIANANNIDEDPEYSISKLKKLKHLCLSDNKLTSFFNSQEFPSSIETLRIENNSLNKLPSISKSSQLEYISLENNPLHEDKLPYKTFESLPHLKGYIDHKGDYYEK